MSAQRQKHQSPAQYPHQRARACCQPATTTNSIAISLRNPVTENQPKTPIQHLLHDLFESLPKYVANKGPESVWSGLQALDEMVHTHQPSFIAVLGRPSMGRTAVVSHLFMSSQQEGQRLFYSIDLTAHMLALRLLTSTARVDNNRLMQGDLYERYFERLGKAVIKLSEMPINILDAYAMSAADIIEDARRHAETQKVSMVVVDGLELLGLSKSNYDAALLGLRSLSRELSCIVCVTLLAGRTADLRLNHRPCLMDMDSDIAETAADVVLGVYRDEYNSEAEDIAERGIMEISVLKQKNGPMGRVKVHFNNAHVGLHNIAPENV